MQMAITTLVTTASALAITASASAGLTVVNDFAFTDGFDLAGAGFNVVGDAQISGNQLVLDGDTDRVDIADPFGGAIDNFLIEVVVTASTVDGRNGDEGFDFSNIFSRYQNGVNNGFATLFQAGNVSAFHSNVARIGDSAATTPGTFSIGFLRQDGTSSVLIDGVVVISNDTVGVAEGTGIDTITLGGINAGAVFDPLTLNGSFARARFSTVQASDVLVADASNDNFLAVVPEPSSLALFSLGGLFLARGRRG